MSEQTSQQTSFQLLQDIARDLSGEVVSFPTFLDITFQVRTALKKPDLSIDQLGTLISAEPLMSTKIIRLANSAAMNSSGKAVVDLNTAISRVGIEAVRSISFAVAMEQLLNSKKMAPFEALSRRLWEHTMEVAAMARVIARRLTRINPDEAMFAGLVHDIGVFYLLSRAVNFPLLVDDHVELQQLLVEWHDHIGHALLTAMGLPDALLVAVQEHEQDRPGGTFKNVGDVLYIANQLANLHLSWRDEAFVVTPEANLFARWFESGSLSALLAESAQDIASLKSALGSR
ncbi:MAG TPA: HDOD domain-containing protein [Accumulibacter sp.]|nr:HDOD domain-containing protein [Accumulibacter sp.]HMW19245.1 HDOD domain-containing protein [Accumulibacter sp.]HMX23715.1 HDOD domain-containing protein [Accumulibacter sp.]HMY07524.1 HDOD domain-containing protein [Accumulibacter sp.]HNC19212.1 HDOD domain-containing protein [Accumulibacter sp.]